MIDQNKVNPRVFLILQGPPSRFCRHLGDGLKAKGHTCLRINLCAADFLMWMGRPAYNYFGKFKHFAGYLERFVEDHGVTDIVYYADRQPYHRVAATVARARGINAYAYEFGYLRPDWITLERGGMSSHSHFPEDPAQILKAAHDLPAPEKGAYHSFDFLTEATHEVLFHLINFFLRVPFIHYRRDRYYNELVEYLHYIPRLTMTARRSRHAVAVLDDLIARKARFFMFALQMQNDYQLRANSKYRLQETAIRDVIASFAKNSSSSDELLFKVHPLDNGMEPWRDIIENAANQHKIAYRVHLVDGGDIGRIIDHVAGLIIINSTTALMALQRDCPVKVLGMAIYDIQGLTHAGSLDSFWSNPLKPNPKLRNAFLRLVAASIQVRGNFYHPEARKHAIKQMVEKLETCQVNEPDAFVDPPPRLERARAAGVPFA